MGLIEWAGMAAMRRMDPEAAHRLALKALAAGVVPLAGAPVTSDRLRVRLAGLDLPNPIGLAAGFDKNAVAIAPLSRAGFGWLEVGGATPRPQAGNPQPRLFRQPGEGAVINRFGFNNEGAAAIGGRLAARVRGPVPVGLNIGANKDSADMAQDFARVVAAAGAGCDFLTVNVSSPNTQGLRKLQAGELLAGILADVKAARAALPHRPPIFVKLSPDMDEAALTDLAQAALEAGIDGLIATNTTQARPNPAAPHAAEAGGLSGRPLMVPSTRVLARLARITGGAVPLVGVGGIGSVDDVWQKLRAGASAVQLYTALAYQGLSLAAQLARGLDARLAAEGIAHVSDLTGTGIDDWL